MRLALMDASVRILSLWSTRAVCPTLNRLGTLVLHAAVCAGVAVASATGVAVATGVVA